MDLAHLVPLVVVLAPAQVRLAILHLTPRRLHARRHHALLLYRRRRYSEGARTFSLPSRGRVFEVRPQAQLQPDVQRVASTAHHAAAIPLPTARSPAPVPLRRLLLARHRLASPQIEEQIRRKCRNLEHP